MFFNGSTTHKQSKRPIRTSLNRQKRRGPLVVNTFVVGSLLLILMVAVMWSVFHLAKNHNNDTPTISTLHSTTNTPILENIRLEFQERYGKYANDILPKEFTNLGRHNTRPNAWYELPRTNDPLS